MAAYLLINGVEVPYPKRGVQPLVSTVVNAGRNANGVTVGQRIGRDLYKINQIVWPWLTAKEWSNISTLLSSFFVMVTFPDPVTMRRITVRMYCSDRSSEPYWVDDNGDPTHYTNCKVNLIDTGE